MQLPSSRERGVVLIYTLIILLILTISAVALVRSMHSSLFTAGNLAFRRDLMNQGEQAVSTVITQFKTGALAGSATTYADNPAFNYYSTMLPTNQQGVPNVLFADNNVDIVGATPDVKIRYVIDRMCNVTGAPVGINCVQSTAAGTSTTAYNNSPPPPSGTVYRLSVRVTGPRNTQVFLQTTFTRPD